MFDEILIFETKMRCNLSGRKQKFNAFINIIYQTKRKVLFPPFIDSDIYIINILPLFRSAAI
jgi:hypothetical protein